MFNDPDAYFGNERKGIAPSQEYLENEEEPLPYYLILLINTTRNFIKIAMRSCQDSMRVLEEGESSDQN